MPKFRAGDIIKTRLDAASWNKKYSAQGYGKNSFWHVYKDGSIAETGYASDPSYCGGAELKGWREDDFVLVNRICPECGGRGRVGNKIKISSKTL